MNVSLDGCEWFIATDPANAGREHNWQERLVADAKPTRVPRIIQEPFPGYHGVAWYWRTFDAPLNPHELGRYVLRFSAVDYLSEVWVNGAHAGGHEGGETPFELDVTHCIKPGARNALAVRVLNPTLERIDGMVLDETPRRCKVMPFRAGAAYNHGGITGSVDLRICPAVRIEDVHAEPDLETGDVRICANVRNAAQETMSTRVAFSISPSATGETFAVMSVNCECLPGDTRVEATLHVDQPHLWDLGAPYLYGVNVRIQVDGSVSVDERHVRCGFREFCFRDGYYHLNGRRIFLRSTHTANHYPIGLQFAHDPDLARRDFLNIKVMGFNMVRFICGGATPENLDLCDEIGLLVYEESYASWFEILETPQMANRFDRSIGELVRRDRNHPSVVIWGLLNEITDCPVFRHAVASLPMLRTLDSSRTIMLNSGRWDEQTDIGSICNPRSNAWEPLLGAEGTVDQTTPRRTEGLPVGYIDQAGDAHVYCQVPQTAATAAFLRSLGCDTKPVFLSEYGIGSAVDLWRTVRHYERLDETQVEDAQYYRDTLDRFLNDFARWGMDACFDRPEDFFTQSLTRMAWHRTLGLNAIRSNPHLVGHNVTGMVDQVLGGEGLTTTFREMKPGTIDAMCECWAPLRLCLFAEPISIYRHGRIRLEAVLANEDALAAGDYPIRLVVAAPDGTKVLDRTVTVTIADPTAAPKPPLAVPVFSEEIAIDGPTGAYRFLASFTKGAAATGGKAEFFVTDAAEMPAIDGDIALWGEDPQLEAWLREHGIRVKSYAPSDATFPKVILVGEKPASGVRATVFAELTQRIEQGATAIFLSPGVFAEGEDPTAWLPLTGKGSLVSLCSWVYLMDAWGKKHPIFDGLPTGGLLDYAYYRDIVKDNAFTFAEPPTEAVAGGITASLIYLSGLMVSVHHQGAGRIILNTLHIRECLGVHPAAERLLRNMLRYCPMP